ncbi:MAG: hypothetical protein AB8G18_01265 [Gammaproteobacteria bacterium]
MFSALKKAFGMKSGSESEISSTQIADPVNHRLQGQAKIHEKYPQVRSLAVNLMISPPDYETEPTLNGRSFGPDSLAFFEFRCKNVECNGGGFDITDIITDSIAKGDRSSNGRRICHGTHGRGPRSHNVIRCNYELNFRVNINYVEN